MSRYSNLLFKALKRSVIIDDAVIASQMTVPTCKKTDFFKHKTGAHCVEMRVSPLRRPAQVFFLFCGIIGTDGIMRGKLGILL